MEKVIAEMSPLKVWALFNVNINRRMTHKAEGLGTCRQVTVKLHLSSHTPGRGDRVPNLEEGRSWGGHDPMPSVGWALQEGMLVREVEDRETSLLEIQLVSFLNVLVHYQSSLLGFKLHKSRDHVYYIYHCVISLLGTR